MGRGQITRYEGAQRSTKHRYTPRHSKILRRRIRRFKRKMIKMLQITLSMVFCIFLATAIMTAAANIIVYTEKWEETTEGHAFVVEEREDVFYNQHQDTNAQKVKFETKFEVREPIALAEKTPKEEVVLDFKEENYKIEDFDRLHGNIADESSVDVVEVIEEELFEEYKPTMISGYEISATGPYEQYIYILSEEDMKIIAKLVWMEARGESYEGMVAVAAVVLNRYFSDDQSFSRESILHTATQKYQFASIWGVTDLDLNDVPDCLEAVKDACKGWDPTRAVFEEGALFFYAPDGVSGYQAQIRQNIKVMVIGNHNFHFNFEKVNV